MDQTPQDLHGPTYTLPRRMPLTSLTIPSSAGHPHVSAVAIFSRRGVAAHATSADHHLTGAKWRFRKGPRV